MTFYALRRDVTKDDVEYAAGTDWEEIVCSHSEGHHRAGRRIGQLKISTPSEMLADFHWTFLGECIVNQKIRDAFEQNNITGYEIEPVGVCDHIPEQRYWELIVVGRGGRAHVDSGIEIEEQCDVCGLVTFSAYENGIIVNSDRWDGCDIFTVEGYPNRPLVTQRVKDLIDQHELVGANLELADELRWPEGVVKP